MRLESAARLLGRTRVEIQWKHSLPNCVLGGPGGGRSRGGQVRGALDALCAGYSVPC